MFVKDLDKKVNKIKKKKDDEFAGVKVKKSKIAVVSDKVKLQAAYFHVSIYI